MFRFTRPESRVRRWAWAHAARRISAATNRGDLELAAAFYDPDVELAFPVAPPTPDRSDYYRGRDTVFEAYRDWAAEWEGLRRVPREVIDVGDTFVVLFEETGRGPASGVQVGQRVGAVFKVRHGRTIRHEEYPDWESALDAAGVPADGGP